MSKSISTTTSSPNLNGLSRQNTTIGLLGGGAGNSSHSHINGTTASMAAPSPPSPTLIRSNTTIVGGGSSSYLPLQHQTTTNNLQPFSKSISNIIGTNTNSPNNINNNNNFKQQTNNNNNAIITNINIDTNITNESIIYLSINNRPSIKLTIINNQIEQINNNNNNTNPSSQTNGGNLMNMIIDSNDAMNQSIVGTIVNNTRRFYFKGIINSIGKHTGVCEDSHFLSADYTSVGVADGVGSWRSVGVDPGEYSRSLMNHSLKLVNSFTFLKPFELIDQAYTASQSLPGSSTVCILKLVASKLYSGLVGDSSFIIIRKDKIVHRSIEQTHKPNHPYQLGQGSPDKPSDGTYMEHIVMENDIIVIGTDGFFDNVYDEEIVDAIRKVDSIETFYTHLMEMAKHKSTDANASTPIASRNSTKGGKIDDITVGCFVVTLQPTKS